MAIGKIPDIIQIPRRVNAVRPVAATGRPRRYQSEAAPFGIIDRVTISPAARRMSRQRLNQHHQPPRVQVYERPARMLPPSSAKVLEYKPLFKNPK